jgi:hypothetical protein
MSNDGYLAPAMFEVQHRKAAEEKAKDLGTKKS